MGIIYRIHCLPTGKFYIGQTVRTLKVRLQQHRRIHSMCTYLHRAIQKYGWDNFKTEILWEGENSLLNEIEFKYIKEFNTLAPEGYNLKEGGEGGGKYSAESCRKLSDSMSKSVIKKNGVLGSVYQKFKNSWCFDVVRNAKRHRMYFPSEEKAKDAQQRYTEDPDSFVFERKRRMKEKEKSELLGGVQQRSKNSWRFKVMRNAKNYYMTFHTEEGAIEAQRRYTEDPESFVFESKKERL